MLKHLVLSNFAEAIELHTNLTHTSPKANPPTINKPYMDGILAPNLPGKLTYTHTHTHIEYTNFMSSAWHMLYGI